MGVDKGVVAEPEADGVVEGLSDDVGEGAVFEAEGRDIVNEAAEEEEKEGCVVAPVEVPEPGEEEAAEDEGDFDDPENGDFDFAGGDAAVALGGMHGIEGRVEDLVEDVVR